MKQDCQLLPLIFNAIIDVIFNAIKQEKEKNLIQVGKKKNKVNAAEIKKYIYETKTVPANRKIQLRTLCN